MMNCSQISKPNATVAVSLLLLMLKDITVTAAFHRNNQERTMNHKSKPPPPPHHPRLKRARHRPETVDKLISHMIMDPTTSTRYKA
jgi:hypothetical protein